MVRPPQGRDEPLVLNAVAFPPPGRRNNAVGLFDPPCWTQAQTVHGRFHSFDLEQLCGGTDAPGRFP